MLINRNSWKKEHDLWREIPVAIRGLVAYKMPYIYKFKIPYHIQHFNSFQDECERHNYSLGCDLLCYNYSRYMVLFTSQPINFFSNSSNAFSSTFILKYILSFYLTSHIRSYYSFGREWWKCLRH